MYEEEEILKEAFDEYRKKGFPYPVLPLFTCKMEINRLSTLDYESCLKSRLAYRVADTYNKHRFHSSAIGMGSPFDAFNDDVKFNKVLKMEYKDGKQFDYKYLGFLSLVNGTQACSNFRPAFAKALYNKYTEKDSVVFDSSTGYGGRLVGFLASHCLTYYGTDPNTETYEANKRLVNDLKGSKNIYLYNSPIEDLDVSHLFEKCDFSFTSPPYFVKEQYSKEETQSCNRYSEYNAWLEGFLRPMMQKNFEVLKKDAHCLVNIEDVNIKNKTYSLVDDCVKISESVGFELQEKQLFALQARTTMSKGIKTTKQANETVLVFKKKVNIMKEIMSEKLVDEIEEINHGAFIVPVSEVDDFLSIDLKKSDFKKQKEVKNQYLHKSGYDTFKVGEDFQRFVEEKLFEKLALKIDCFKDGKNQRLKGENPQGFEIKYDSRCTGDSTYSQCTATNRLAIELYRQVSDSHWIKSGILRDDNTWIYIVGNYQGFWMFGKRDLVRLFKKNNYEVTDYKTLRRFFISIEEANEYCLNYID